ncbi:MAG: tetratricopeptide repeat protein [Sphingobacteriaceae bacterium]|nr:tetratricopeptide repeat protein [Sphingobacteriaceae bacterium]
MSQFDFFRELKQKVENGNTDIFEFYRQAWPKIVTLPLNELDEIIAFGEKYKQAGNLQLAYHLFTVAMIDVFKGKYNSSLDNCKLAITLFEIENNQEGLLATFCMQGIAYRSIGQLDLAQQNIQSAISLIDKTQNSKLFNYFKSVTCYQAGELCQQFGDYNSSVEYYIQGQEFTGENIELNGRICSAIGTCYMKLNDFDNAFNYFTKALTTIQNSESPNALMESKIYGDLGDYYFVKKEMPKALEYHLQSLEIRKSNNLQNPICTSYLALSKIYLNLKDYEKSLSFANQALDLAIALKVQMKQYEAHELLAYSFECTGNIAEAYAHFKKFHQIKDEVLNQEVIKKIENLNNKHKIESSEKEKEIFRLKNIELKGALNEIHDSFTYASRIQRALIPNDKYIQSSLEKLKGKN